ncbi:hypothetical protein Q2R95_004366 [Escherichia coli]|nr:hypothetical protein [Escherichia coli]ELM8940452.1 hypothetical protein [Escherichia coli]
MKGVKPRDIALPENTPLEGGAVFVKLQTLDALDTFWNQHRNQFAYAANGCTVFDGGNFLDGDEWVFGPSKVSVVKAAMRWDQMGIGCEWYDWPRRDPAGYETYHMDRKLDRAAKIKEGTWTAEDEARFLERTPENYQGWWILTKLPLGLSFDDWTSLGAPELRDPTLSHAAVIEWFQNLTFDDWRNSDGLVSFYDAPGVDEYISMWREDERLEGGEC